MCLPGLSSKPLPPGFLTGRSYLRTHLPGLSLLWAVYVGACLGSWAIVSVFVLSTRRHRHANLSSRAKESPHAAGAHCTTHPAGFFPSRRSLPVVASRFSSSPLETCCVGETVLHTLSWARSRLVGIRTLREGLLLWGGPLTTTLPWLHLGHDPPFPPNAGPNVTCKYSTTDEVDEKQPPRLASNPHSSAFSEPIQAACPQSLCSIDIVVLHLDMRRQTAPRGLALPGLACKLSSETALSAVRTPGGGGKSPSRT